MKRYFQKEIETAPVDWIKSLQAEKLVKQVKYVYDHNKYYHRLMDEKGVTPDDIKGLDDLHKLPFLTKNDLREAYPYGLLSAPLKDCVRIQSTSGTTGRISGQMPAPAAYSARSSAGSIRPDRR